MGNGSRCVLLSVSLTGVSMFRWNSVWTGAAFDDFCPVSGWWNAGGNPVLKMERVLQFKKKYVILCPFMYLINFKSIRQEPMIDTKSKIRRQNHSKA